MAGVLHEICTVYFAAAGFLSWAIVPLDLSA